MAGPGFIDRRVSWVGAWEPGGTGDEYPSGTGMAIVPGSTIVMQMHYHKIGQPEESRGGPPELPGLMKASV